MLNAGIIPRCVTEGTYNPLVIRFGAWVEGATATPLDITKTALAKDYERATFLDALLAGDTSLWHHAKTRQLNGGGRPLLLFDQFEELFSYPAEQVQAFQEELSELLNTNIPLRFQRLAEASAILTEEEEDLLETPLEARIVFAIRSDRMHLLDRLKDYLPNVLRHCFELKALNPKDAEEAILLPAQAVGNFLTASFTYSQDALQKLLDFLTDTQDGRIEGILLQMLCEHYERRMVEGQRLTILDIPQIGDPEQVVKKYYEEKIEDLPLTQQLASRRLIEDGLVSEGEGMRLSLHESYISNEFGIRRNLLEKLVDSRLLRSEPFIRGGYTYELAHDRLVPAVLDAKKLRIENELKEKEDEERRIAEENRILKEQAAQAEKERMLRQQAEQAKNEAEKARIDAERLKLIAQQNEINAKNNEHWAKQRTRLAVIISILALILMAISIWSFLSAHNARMLAEQKKQEAETQKNLAEKSLNDFQRADAEKLALEFDAMVARANIILDAGGCPKAILTEIEEIANKHPDNKNFSSQIQTLNAKNSVCK